MLITDAAGLVTFVNPAAETLLRRASLDLLGRPVAGVFRITEIHEPPAVLGDEGAVGAPRECVLGRDDGSHVAIEEREAAIRDAQGTLLGAIKTFRDITSRKRIDAERDALLQAERTAREEADAASRLKDEFLATISHELRTPATSILGWIRLLKTGRLDGNQAGKALDAVERGAHTQATLLEDLLDMSRIVRGTLRIDPEPTSVAEVLNGAVDIVTPAVRARSLQCVVRVPDDLPLVQADPDRLRQVFWNLLSNAVKFTEPGGSITVTGWCDTERVYVEVADTGRGIDSQAMPYIFDRFRQADGSTTRAQGGLGLGLAIVRHLIELHGGAVTAESAGSGRGARFRVTLPLTAPNATPAADREAPSTR